MKKYSDEFIANRKIARYAGLWYLILAITSGYSWMAINKILVPGDPTLTAKNLLNSDSQYLISIVSSIIGQISFILLGLTLYNLLKAVNKTQAKLMLSLILISVPVMFVNIIFQAGAFLILIRSDYLKVFTPDQLDSIAMLFVNMNITGVYIVQIFWGLWLFPFAYLVYRSNFIPKIIAVLLVISGLSYLIGSFSSLLSPAFFAAIQKFLSIPEALGEMVVLIWLLAVGIKPVGNRNMA